MPALLYLHGFLSSPRSHKAIQVQSWLGQNRPDISYYCPYLTPYFGEVQKQLDEQIQALWHEPVFLVGSSLGGFWASYLAEKYDLRAVLINPVVRPGVFNPEYIGVVLKNYHTEDTYVLTNQHIRELTAADTPVINTKANYWLMVQSGDETLDYRLALKKYAGCKQLVEEGGDHSFQGFERWVPQVVRFLEGEREG